MPLMNKPMQPVPQAPPVVVNRFGRFVWTFTIGSMLIGGLGFYAYGQYPEWFNGIANTTNTNRQVAGRHVIIAAPKLDATQKDAGSVSYENYDGFGNMQKIKDESAQQKGAILRGFINMPATGVSRGIYLPIYEGVSPYILSMGAGVGQPDRQMGGKDNFPVFAHNMGDYKTAYPSYFSPLQTMNQNVIGAPVYTTDGSEIFKWQVTSLDSHTPNTQTSVMATKIDQEPELTLVACQEDAAWWQRFRATGNTYAPERIVVKGKLLSQEDFAKAPKQDQELFPDLLNKTVTTATDSKNAVSNPNLGKASKTTKVAFWISSHIPDIMFGWSSLLLGLIGINLIHSWRLYRKNKQ